MSTLEEKLRSLGVTKGAESLRPRRDRHHGIENVVEGKVVSGQFGETYWTESVFPIDHYHGIASLQPLSSNSTISIWAQEPTVANADIKDFVFIDTETTGLSAASGTFAFMVGAGRFIRDYFHLIQLFLRDPTEESAQLNAFEEFIAGCSILVSYNGKSFDVPLLNTRYITNSLPSPLPGMAHLDMLHLCRRLWRDRLPSRTLIQIESQILQVIRTQEDIPGWMIPGLYRDYLISGDARPLKSVFYHNAMDVLSLVGILNWTTALLDNLSNVIPDEPIDLVSMGKLFEDIGQKEKAIDAYQRGLEGNLPSDAHWETVMRLSIIHKRDGNYPLAIPLWKEAANSGQINAFVELAKYYEHKARQIEQAMEWTKSGIELIQSRTFPNYAQSFWMSDFGHRLNRLERKSR